MNVEIAWSQNIPQYCWVVWYRRPNWMVLVLPHFQTVWGIVEQQNVVWCRRAFSVPYIQALPTSSCSSPVDDLVLRLTFFQSDGG